MIIPRVKEFQAYVGTLQVGNAFSCFAENEIEKFAVDYLSIFFAERVLKSQDANLIFIENSAYKSEEYSVDVSARVVVEYSDKLSVRNAISSLIQLCTVEKGIISVNKCRIHDCPDAEHRSVMIDIVRGLPDIVRLKEDLLRLALVKCRFVHFHLMDMSGMCYLSDVFPLDTPIRGTKRYTKAMLKDLIEYCDSIGLEVIPGIEIPSHAHSLTQFFPNLMCKTDIENPSNAVVCAGNEDTYGFYEKLIDEISEIFTSKYIQVGGDELYFGDLPEWNWFCHWLECSECKALMEREGITSQQQLYYYVMNRIKKLLDSRGKTMIMFNDEIDISEEVNLPKDIIIQFWRVANEKRGPRKGCSLESFAKNGFKVINSDFRNCYFDAEQYANAEKLSYFEYDKIPECSEGYRQNIIGGDACFWEYGNPLNKHYDFSFFYSSALFLDKLWNKKAAVYDKAYRKALTKIILGLEVEEDLDISDLFGSVLPPRRNDMLSYVSLEDDTMDYEMYDEIMQKLHNINRTYSKYFIDRLIYEFENNFKGMCKK